jgi:Ferritin-like domain
VKYLKRALFNEQEHYQALAEILSGAGQTPATAGDFDFAYPKGSFGSKLAIAKLGIALETTFLGAYLGAVDALLTNGLKQPVARIAASEAEHLSVFTRLSGGDPVGISFPAALTIDEASNALDAYSS